MEVQDGNEKESNEVRSEARDEAREG